MTYPLASTSGISSTKFSELNCFSHCFFYPALHFLAAWMFLVCFSSAIKSFFCSKTVLSAVVGLSVFLKDSLRLFHCETERGRIAIAVGAREMKFRLGLLVEVGYGVAFLQFRGSPSGFRKILTDVSDLEATASSPVKTALCNVELDLSVELLESDELLVCRSSSGGRMFSVC